MTLEDALGYPPVTLDDFVMARLMRSHLPLVVVATQHPARLAMGYSLDTLNEMTNADLLDAISRALEDMKGAGR
jgi:hypothetical protein